MVHTSHRSRHTARARLSRRMLWGGMAVTAISMASLALFSIYHLLAGVALGAGAAVPSSIWIVGGVALAAGALSTIVGGALGAEPAEHEPVGAEPRARRTIAA